MTREQALQIFIQLSSAQGRKKKKIALADKSFIKPKFQCPWQHSLVCQINTAMMLKTVNTEN